VNRNGVSFRQAQACRIKVAYGYEYHVPGLERTEGEAKGDEDADGHAVMLKHLHIVERLQRESATRSNIRPDPTYLTEQDPFQHQTED
jgi:hypothetical protein